MTGPSRARLDPDSLVRPTLRALDVVTTLADFAIVTWAVDPERVARHLAPGFEPDVRALDDGREVALVSAVPFRDLDFRFAAFPWLRFRMGQTNYRAYVIRRATGERCAWFFGTALTRPFVHVPRVLWRLPWHPARMRFRVSWEAELCTRYSLRTRSSWGACELEAAGSQAPMGRLDGFADEEETLVVLTHPLQGYYYRTDGRVGTYSVWHERSNLRRARAERSRFTVLERLGLIQAEQPPHSVLVQRETEFVIRLPPRLLRGDGAG